MVYLKKFLLICAKICIHFAVAIADNMSDTSSPLTVDDANLPGKEHERVQLNELNKNSSENGKYIGNIQCSFHGVITLIIVGVFTMVTRQGGWC